MNKLKVINDSEIDLIEIFETLWNNKLKLFGFTVICTLLVFLYFKDQERYFIANVKLNPITSYEYNNYKKNNDFGFYKIDILNALQLYIEIINDRKIIEQVIIENELVEKKEYDNEKDYYNAVASFASSFSIRKENYDIKNANVNTNTSNWVLSVDHYDVEKIKIAINSINNLVNHEAKNILKLKFNTYLSSAQQIKNFEIEDIERLMQYSVDDYIHDTEARLAFLREQAIIARKLKIEFPPNNFLTFQADKGLITKFEDVNNPFFTRGYVAIESEIDLLQNRDNKELFINKLFELENKKRSLIEDKTLQRAEFLFNSSPVYSDNFYAAKLEESSLKIEYFNSLLIPVALAGIISSIVCAIHILLWNSIKNRRKKIL